MQQRLVQTLLMVAVCQLAFLADQSWGQTVVYDGQGDGWYSPATGDYGGTGEATHLGNHTILGNVETIPTSLLTAIWYSTTPQETVAADGSILYFDAVGTVELIPLDNTFTTFSAIWTGEFKVAGGTGRFANVQPADEPLKVEAINAPFTLTDTVWDFAWTLEGQIKLK